jgi:hypothetical protein
VTAHHLLKAKITRVPDFDCAISRGCGQEADAEKEFKKKKKEEKRRKKKVTEHPDSRDI